MFCASWLFGTLSVVTYFVGPFLLYLAYLLASGYHVGTFIGKVLLLACAAGRYGGHLRTLLGRGYPWQTVKMLFAWGSVSGPWCAGVYRCICPSVQVKILVPISS